MAIDIAKLEDSPHLIDLLVQMEDVIDSLDLYVFENWFNGTIVAGPSVRRYWLGMTLEYDHDKCPDQRGALRLIKHGIQVKIQKGKRGQRKHMPGMSEDHETSHDIWLVDISIPRRLITFLNAGQLDFYDEDVDIEDVKDASDAGMTDETGYVDDESNSDLRNGEPSPLDDQDMAVDGANAAPEGENGKR